jgi:hypothetical protein
VVSSSERKVEMWCSTVVYGHERTLEDVAGRPGGVSGEEEHDRSVEQHRQRLARLAEADQGTRRGLASEV